MAWATEGTVQYQDDDILQKIIAGMDIVYKLVYNENLQMDNRDNWWAIE